MVAMFSDRWGTYPTPQTGGKIVWALCGTDTDQPISTSTVRRPGA
jgi:hypothetical protein